MSKIYKIREGLYQAAHHNVVKEWEHIRDTLKPDVILVLCPPNQTADRLDQTDGPLVLDFPIHDNPNGLDQRTFDMLVKICRILSPWSVVTVCAMGENRSGLASALILYRAYSGTLTMKEIIEIIRERVKPESGAGAESGASHVLWNPGFVKQLLEFAE